MEDADLWDMRAWLHYMLDLNARCGETVESIRDRTNATLSRLDELEKSDDVGSTVVDPSLPLALQDVDEDRTVVVPPPLGPPALDRHVQMEGYSVNWRRSPGPDGLPHYHMDAIPTPELRNAHHEWHNPRYEDDSDYSEDPDYPRPGMD